jgi:hypothetical protein
MLRRLNGGGLASVMAFALGLFLLLPSQANAQKISDLRQKAERFHSDSESLYRLDDNDMQQIWEAYCGVFDPKIKEDREFAADVARQLQDKEKGIVDQLLGNDLPSLLEDAKKIQQNSDADAKDKNEAKDIEDSLRKEEKKLHDLYNGVPLKGSNHPFVQYAIEYGKSQHVEMCDKFGEQPRVCDKNFPGMEGRPDLVVVDSGHLVVYEFKPDNSAATTRGWKQVKDYLPAVVTYYQNFFEDGRNGGFKSEPDSDHGGVEILKKLKNSRDAWSSDGKVLQAIPEVKTYRMCDKKFN